MTTVPMRCAVCGGELGELVDPLLPPLRVTRVRICRHCKRVVCWWHSVRVGDEFECTECREGCGPAPPERA